MKNKLVFSWMFAILFVFSCGLHKNNPPQPVESVMVKKNDICSQQRKLALDLGLIDKKYFDFEEEFDEVPWFKDEKNPRMGIAGFMDCDGYLKFNNKRP